MELVWRDQGCREIVISLENWRGKSRKSPMSVTTHGFDASKAKVAKSKGAVAICLDTKG
jgi:hypothetical protein